VGQNLEGKLLVIRMQANNIISPNDENNLGAILIADTFFSIDQDTFINVSKNVPHLENWYTTNKHYESLP